MRTWIEKLAKRIEKEGRYLHRALKLDDLEIYLGTDYSDMSKYISFYDNKYGAQLKIYEDEFDFLKESVKKCKQKAEDHFIEIINSFE